MFCAAGGVASASAVEAHAASTVHVVIIRSHGEVLVGARVRIHGQLFPFLIDTGASKSLLTPAIVRRLHLKSVGKPHKFCGVAACTTARKVRLSRWSIGGVVLPTVTAVSSPLAGTGNVGAGLLGSDVLSKFGSVTIDYKNGLLTLG